MKQNSCRRWFIVVSLWTLLAAPAPLAFAAPPPKDFSGATPLEWSVRMADSEIARKGDKLAWKPSGGGKWDYTAGLFTLSLLKLNEKVPTPAYVDFTTNAIGTFITPDGNIQGYRRDEYQLDALNPGKTVLALWQLTKEERYRRCAAMLRDQLNAQPRTSDGGFWHKQRYTNQMWLDGLYMGAPFYAECAQLFNEPAAFDDVARQFRLIDQHTFDPNSGLFYHGWDEKKQLYWANPLTGTSSNFWGRAVGWYAMGLVDTLDYLPKDHPARKAILASLKKVCAGIIKWQDADSGLWWQVMDQGPREGNYLEATASTMFVYTIAKAVNQGYLSSGSKKAALKGYERIITRLIRTDADGRISLTKCCSVAGLGSMDPRKPRDGSFAYYLSEPIVDNDLKGVGPFILAGLEMQQLLELPMTVTKTSTTDTQSSDSDWAQMAEILARIKAPTFPNREFPITEFGAKGDGQVDCTEAIRKAIEACANQGGGRVLVPAGEFLTGPIYLKSGVNLHLAHEATLKFSTDPKAYLPAVLTRFEGMECWNLSPLIYAYGEKDIAVTGDGTLDGQASDENWWGWKGRSGASNTQTSARKRLAQMVADNVPVSERRFGEGSFLRPSFIEPHLCRNILIEGVRIRRSPMWEVHPTLCTNVTVRGLHIETHGPNNDGCDPECSRDVLIENTLFDTGDDCIAIKSGRNNDGRRVGVASENLVIRKCTMKDGHGGVTIGSEISGGCRNVFVEDCDMDSVNLDRVFRFKSNAVRGGVIENVFMRNVRVGKVGNEALQIDFTYEEGANGPYKPVVRNVRMENVSVRQTPRVLDVRGFPGSVITNVVVRNCSFAGVSKPDTVQEADVKLENCKIERAK